MKTNDIEESRLEDFKRILTYRIVTKIVHDFKGDCDLYYKAPRIWAAWRGGNIQYSKKIYELIIKFNSTALSKNQVKSIFGRDHNRKWLNYAALVESEGLQQGDSVHGRPAFPALQTVSASVRILKGHIRRQAAARQGLGRRQRLLHGPPAPPYIHADKQGRQLSL